MTPTVTAIAAANGRLPEEVGLRWALQNGCAVSVRPTTDFGLGRSACDAGVACKDGLLARSKAFEWSLTDAEMSKLAVAIEYCRAKRSFARLKCLLVDNASRPHLTAVCEAYGVALWAYG